MRFASLVILYLLLPIAVPSVMGQGKNTGFVLDRGDIVEDLLFRYYELYRFNGAVLVADDDEIVYENTFGFADFDEELPLDSNTPFYLASLGKQFIATAIMKLSENNKIDLNDPLTRYFPLLPGFYAEVRISNLLNHTSGIPDYLSAAAVKDMTNQQVYQYLSSLSKLEFKPGSKYRYSNSGYVLLAMIVEVATGQPIDNYFAEEYFSPLDMKNTFIYTKETNEHKRAYGFNDKSKPEDYELYTVGDGGFYSTTNDLFTWLVALNNGEIISDVSLEKMYEPVQLESGREKRYGYGWELGSNSGGPLVYHSGQLAGFRTYLERQNSSKRTMIILTNNSFSKIVELRNQLIKILDGRLTSISDN